MKILVLGGTQFVGRYIVKQALINHHEVTLFNRGKTNPELFRDLEQIIGDRDGGLEGLKGRAWDTVIDVNGYVPRLVSDSARLLKDAIGQYVFVSTISVYASPFPVHGDETASVKTLPDPASEDVGRYYGELKLSSERTLEEIMPGRSLILRPGVVAGPYDRTDRATYWATRAARGGQMLAPGKPDQPFQVIDVRDLATFILLAVEKEYTGTYNTAGESITWAQWLEAAISISGTHPDITWIPDWDFLQNNLPQTQNRNGALPLYLPESNSTFWTVSSERAQSIGLKHRPTSEIVRDILEHESHRLLAHPYQAGLTPDEELVLLRRWEARA